ncbi:type II secretion system F family protein [Novibacillus thermophilus]|uniref:Uncharacterized protein n=1 Tax=Novibacillus thermophilus TaxID=1471761 RepID=A0A1U9KAG6_9BACL|nr:hypothetical protein [Novibacillus thermophilus]AQS57006.1 hypothetical protein B0W44_15870 [Novibacillus thermophilus]
MKYWKGLGRRVNNRWARQFVNLLLLREERGADIEDGLFNLVKQMKTSQIETQREKAEMAQTRMIHLILMISAMGLFLYNLPGNYGFVTTEPLGRSIVTVVAVLLLVSLAIFIIWIEKRWNERADSSSFLRGWSLFLGMVFINC